MVFMTAVFFVSFILINSFIILNVIVAALLDGMMSEVMSEDGPDFMDDGIAPLQKAGAVLVGARPLEEAVRALRAEVADLNSKMDTLIRMQRGPRPVRDSPDPPNILE